jgi:hypothetical protein
MDTKRTFKKKYEDRNQNPKVERSYLSGEYHTSFKDVE